MNIEKKSFMKTAAMLAVLLLSLLDNAIAETGGSAAEALNTTAEVAQVEPVPDSLRSPRATFQTFLDSMNAVKQGQTQAIQEAVSTLDLSNVNNIVRKEHGANLAWRLFDLLQRNVKIKAKKAPSYENGKPWVLAKFDSGSIVISRQADKRWLFSASSLQALQAILQELDKKGVVQKAETEKFLPWHLRFREQLPELLRQRSFILENWKWVGLLLIIAAGFIFDKLLSMFLRRLFRGWKTRTRYGAFKEVSDDLLRPLGLMAMAALWWWGVNLLAFPESALLVLLVAVKFLVGLSGVWSAYRLVDLAGAWMLDRARGTSSKLDDALYPLLIRTLKVFVTVVGALFVASNLSINISGLIAGLGLGGLAFALAAKDMVQNLFGSITVLLDRTFTVGDWIVVDGIEGSVERIGFRSTRVRTFYNSRVTVPNSKFITANVDNMGERRYRRYKTNLSINYDTPADRIEMFCEAIRELVRLHPYMRKDYYHVYFNDYAESGLNVLIYVFWQTPDWGTELRERHRFLLDILRVAKQLNVEFAFPTRTLHLFNEEQAAMQDEVQDDADAGREVARAVVEQSTGLGTRPPPVRF
ncbi:MAG: mechanosensitive ion channel family protein [gamma proteobacterium symbiont of Bathyaustriella thionipta]|nr:mechanosensitive ion channel family protein [gamma proteobacterium symbiont of Bathyaustriella thionipta]